jgi:hypothetical protein
MLECLLDLYFKSLYLWILDLIKSPVQKIKNLQAKGVKYAS